jgi:hypothetical protein
MSSQILNFRVLDDLDIVTEFDLASEVFQLLRRFLWLGEQWRATVSCCSAATPP